MKNYHLIYFAVLLISLSLYRCAGLPVEVSGGASGTDLSACILQGVVFDSLDHPVDLALIRLRPQHFLPSLTVNEDSSIIETIIDSRSTGGGTFRIDSVVPGYYMLEVTSCRYGFSSLFTVRKGDSLIVLPPCILRGMSNITGQLHLPPDILQANDIHLEVYGFEYSVKVDTNGMFTMTVPGGDYWVRVHLSQSDTTEFDFPVKTRPGERLDLGVVEARRDRMEGEPPVRRVPPSISR